MGASILLVRQWSSRPTGKRNSLSMSSPYFWPPTRRPSLAWPGPHYSKCHQALRVPLSSNISQVTAFTGLWPSRTIKTSMRSNKLALLSIKRGSDRSISQHKEVNRLHVWPPTNRPWSRHYKPDACPKRTSKMSFTPHIGEGLRHRGMQRFLTRRKTVLAK